MTKDELLQKIEQAAREGTTELYLVDEGLTELPPEIGQLTQLQGLYIHNNQLTQLPPEIGQLTQLGVLDLSKNKLTQLPPEIGQLTQLQELDLSFNPLTQLPPEIGQLTQLQELNLWENQLTQLPPEMGQLTQLQRLNLWENQLTQLPPEMGQLTRLQELYLSGNQLTELPPILESVARIIETNINSLSEKERKKPFLCLWLSNNPFRIPILPEILARTRQPTDIISFWKELTAGSRPLHEAKLLLVGQSGVGKTSLVNRLLHDTYNDHELKTDGIAINQWSVATPTGDAIRLHIWDFGGQEVMHATHQFFLTQRSLYLLVLDARQGEQESRVKYWLKLIQSFGGKSPILVVVNKVDDHPLDLNCMGLLSKYPTIKAFFNVSCKTTEGLAALKAQIEQSVNKDLPRVHDYFPTTWFSLKDTLGNMSEDYLTYDHYLDLCQRVGITNATSQRILISVLHDLGIVLNFRDDPSHPQLAETHILNPEWVTQGVYTLLNSRALIEAQGVLAMAHLSQFLDAKRYPAHKQHLIVDIMEKFELCFAFDERRQQFLIPELLPKNEPELWWWDKDRRSLRFEYHYDVLPSSVISRFIVRAHPLIKDKIYWHTGVILARDNNEAVVKADLEDKKIFIWVTGNDHGKRALLAIIRAHFKHIHQSISKIQVTEQVSYRGGIVIPYQSLLKLEKCGIERYYFPEFDGQVNVVQLLDGIADEATRSKEMDELGE